MNRLVITPRHLHTIGRIASMTYPEECCGVLVGRPQGDSTIVIVERILTVQNERQEGRHNRYLISPETVLAAQKEARALGLDIVGYFHSHPDRPARPSEFDREHAWPGYSYLIVSVQNKKVMEARSWRLSDDRERFDEEVIDQAAGASFPGYQPMGVHREAV